MKASTPTEAMGSCSPSGKDSRSKMRAEYKTEWLKNVQSKYPESHRAYLAEKEKLALEHGLHKYFLWDDYFKPHQNFFLSWLEENMPSRDVAILDAGCGIGFLALRLHDLGYNNYQGIDINESNIRVGIKLLSKFELDPNLRSGSIEETGFEEGRFDVVCALDASYDSGFSMDLACKEIHRVLKQGGYLVTDIAYAPLEYYDNLYSKDEMEKHLSGFSNVEFLTIPKREKLKYGVVARR